MTTPGHPKGDLLEDIARSVVDYFSNACSGCSLDSDCTHDDAACAPRDVQEAFVLGKLLGAIEAVEDLEATAFIAALTTTSEETGE